MADFSNRTGTPLDVRWTLMSRYADALACEYRESTHLRLRPDRWSQIPTTDTVLTPKGGRVELLGTYKYAVLDLTIRKLNHQLSALLDYSTTGQQKQQIHQRLTIPPNMQFTKLAMALFAASVIAAPAASPVDVDESPATTTVRFTMLTGATGPVPQDCCLKCSWHGCKWGCGKICD
ncbi:hypothetical protein Q7P36_000571 [Cladosporium allicinum]